MKSPAGLVSEELGVLSCSVTEERDLGEAMSNNGKMDITQGRNTEDITGEIAHFFSHCL